MRVEQLTFLRFIAAFALVIYHYGTKVYPFNQDSISGLFYNANLGVSFFFVLSGYVLMLAYGQLGTISKKTFYKKRFARIYPIYIIGVLLMTIYYCSAYLVGGGDIPKIQPYLSNVFLVQSWMPNHALRINYVGWTLSVEVFFYLIFPFIHKLFKKYSIQLITTIVIFFWTLSQVVFWKLKMSPFYMGFPSDSHNFIFYFPPFHLNQFLIGALAGYYFITLKGTLKLSLIGTGLAIVLFVPFLQVTMEFGAHNGLFAIPFAVLLLLFSRKDIKLLNLFSSKLLVFLGGVSYSMYILQVPVFEWYKVIVFEMNISISKELFFYSGFVLLLLVSCVCYRFIETPLRNKLTK